MREWRNTIFFIVDNITTSLKFMNFIDLYNTHITEIFRSDKERKSACYPYTPADLYESYKRREKVYKITAPYISSQQILIRDEYYICNVKYQRDQHDLCNFFAILEDVRPCE